MKIIIIGPKGTGKTTFVVKLLGRERGGYIPSTQITHFEGFALGRRVILYATPADVGSVRKELERIRDSETKYVIMTDFGRDISRSLENYLKVGREIFNEDPIAIVVNKADLVYRNIKGGEKSLDDILTELREKVYDSLDEKIFEEIVSKGILVIPWSLEYMGAEELLKIIVHKAAYG